MTFLYTISWSHHENNTSFAVLSDLQAVAEVILIFGPQGALTYLC